MKKRSEKKAHQYLDAMPPVTYINVPIGTNQKESTLFRKEKRGKCRKKKKSICGH